jgi:hypothetical protein
MLNNVKNALIIILILFGAYLWLSRNTVSKNEAIIQRLEDSLSRKIDTLLVEKDSVVFRYKDSKKIIYLRDSIYISDRNLENCDSLVVALKKSLDKCDTVINVSDTIIKTMLVRDTFRQEHIQYLKNKNNFFFGAGPALSLTPQGIQPGVGLFFGIKLK